MTENKRRGRVRRVREEGRMNVRKEGRKRMREIETKRQKDRDGGGYLLAEE